MKKTMIPILALLLLLCASPIARAENGSVISVNAKYSIVTPPSAAYADDGMKLSDDLYGTIPDGSTNYYASNAYVGFNSAEADKDGNFVIIFDLQRVYRDLSAFTVGFLNETSAGIYAPKSVTFAVSESRNGEYENVGTLNTEKATSPALSETYAETLAADDVSGRYVRITITPLREFINVNGEISSAAWTFIDEISIYSSGNASDDEPTDESKPSAEESNTPDEITPSAPPEESTDTENPKPQAGDANLQILAFLLLAVSAVTMMFALFGTNKKPDDF